MNDILEQVAKAKRAGRELAVLSTTVRNNILEAMADGIMRSASIILAQNKLDVELARQNGKSEAMLDRLSLNRDRIQGMADGLMHVVTLKDPLNDIDSGGTLPNGLRVTKVRVPIGVVGMIYESRPNVTADAIGLCIKSGNAVVLRGSSEAIRSNTVIANAAIEGGRHVGLPDGAVHLIKNTSREAAEYMMKLNGYLDVLIPRGGAGLIKTVVENSTVPVIETGTGNCHIYVDQWAEMPMALNILINAKTSRPGVCNACESLLVHSSIAELFLPQAIEVLVEKGVQIRGCERTQKYGNILPASEEDYATEFLDYIISVKVVDSVDEAIEHINRYGTGHSEVIVTSLLANARKFQSLVDAAAVYVNASSRFTDGSELGMGAEIGISTQKLHARGPMGLFELTTHKYLIEGEGQVR